MKLSHWGGQHAGKIGEDLSGYQLLGMRPLTTMCHHKQMVRMTYSCQSRLFLEPAHQILVQLLSLCYLQQIQGFWKNWVL